MTTDPKTDVDLAAERDERKRRKAAVAKYSLAGVALLGIGAALTSAAWTDNAWFQAQASSVNPDTAIDLRGAFNATDPDVAPAEDTTEVSWKKADVVGDAISFDVSGTLFADLVPGDEIETTLWLWNAGTHDLTLAAPSVFVDGQPYDPAVGAAAGNLFADGGATFEIVTSPAGVLRADTSGDTVNDKVAVPVKVTMDADAPESFGAKTATVTIQFEGSIAARGNA